MKDYDLIVVGAGIVGLAHALLAARAGRRVLVLDRDAQANGASIRNFGFVTVTGHGSVDTWRRAKRAREVWAEVAPLAGIAVNHRGLLMCARRAEAARCWTNSPPARWGRAVACCAARHLRPMHHHCAPMV